MRDGVWACWILEQNGFGEGSRIKIRRWEVEDDEDGGTGPGDSVRHEGEMLVLIVGGISEGDISVGGL